MQREIYEFCSTFETPNFEEGIGAFLEKRKPNFREKWFST
jgi:enoyl-CoA hydratase/carnithine racemase